MTKPFYTYLDDRVSFTSKDATKIRTIYAPLCGPSATSLKSSITPYLSGDIKLDQNHYLTKPMSTEDLRNNMRNFFVNVEGKGIFMIGRESDEDASHIEVGQLWHKLVRKHAQAGLQIESLNFIPSSGDNIELMQIIVKNISNETVNFTPTAVIPMFARALANKHDHEHVTSLLHRIKQLPEGVVVEPTMKFDEEGHLPADSVYFVYGKDDQGNNPIGTFPTVESFWGDSAPICRPEAVVNNVKPESLADSFLKGKEAAGALRFKNEKLASGKEKKYVLVMGVADSQKQAKQVFDKFSSIKDVDKALEENKNFWQKKSQVIDFQFGDSNFNSWMRWVTIQPVLRRIFGNSFLPDHDYGKGGRGWRDLWQDLLSLILIEPERVRVDLIDNFAGIRIDGSNATIIGSKPGEFIADRNAISRVWMDHGAWPILTVLLYINQTGDFDLLLEENTYFRDMQLSRTFEKDLEWTPADGNNLKTVKGDKYKSTIIEHILLQNLVPFFNVGEHNLMRLEGADWNDGLDMAPDRGESVAFTSFYGGNLVAIADLLEALENQKDVSSLKIAKEMMILLDPNACDYDDIDTKKKLLFAEYFQSVQPKISGEKVDVSIKDIVSDLRKKGEWVFAHIKKQEKVSVKEGGKQYSWFNGYYDNKGKKVEGKKDGRIWMTLTGQVFPLLSGLANDAEIKEVVESVNGNLKDKALGGIRLNTDFGLPHYLDMGRAFGFAYGTKENGAFFSHMTVMYAFALYSRGFAREGYEVLKSIYNMCVDTDKSKIYPGIPEYCDSNGKGMYHFLTGSASWLVLAMLTQVFGVKGENGDLTLAPKLVKEEFSDDGKAQVSCFFAGKQLSVEYINKQKKDFGSYKISEVLLNNDSITFQSLSPQEVLLKRDEIINCQDPCHIQVILD